MECGLARVCAGEGAWEAAFCGVGARIVRDLLGLGGLVGSDGFGEDFGVEVEEFGAGLGAVGVEGALDGFELSLEVGRGGGDGDQAEAGTVVDEGLVELGDGDVEVVAELVLNGAHRLATIFEGVGVGDIEFEEDLSDGHKGRV
jgi:hypothetical protein